MSPENLYFSPDTELEEKMFDLKSDSNKRARKTIKALERVLFRGTTEKISLAPETPYFTLKSGLSGGFLLIAGIHYLERGTREVDGETAVVEEIGGGTVVLDYSGDEKREELIDAKDQQGGIERVEIEVAGDPKRPSNIYKFDDEGRPVLKVKILSVKPKRGFSVPQTVRRDIDG